MIEFNKLLVIPYNKGLYIDCSIMDMPFFKDVYLDKIIIDSQDTFNKDGVSKTPIYKYNVEGNKKSIQLTIRDTELLVRKMENTIFFVYVIIKGLPSSDTPCGLDSPVTLGVAVDAYSVYRKALNYLYDVNNSCTIPKKFIDFILKYKAFQICLKTRDYTLAITYWKNFVKSFNRDITNNCSCYG